MRFLFLCIVLFIDCFYASYQVTEVVQKDLLITAELGANVTILCNFSTGSLSKISWYKQILGNRPLLVVETHRYLNEAIFYNGLNKNHYIVHIEDGSYALRIVKIEPSDSATYYCAVNFMNVLTFGEGTVLLIKGSEGEQLSSHTVLQLPELEVVNPGDSLNLQCTVLTKSCAGEHSIYWFRHGSGESHPGIIYTHRDNSHQCKKNSEARSPTQSCVYELPKRNLSLSDAGTYYCAVVMCGEILFGNGTKVFFNETNMETWKVLALVLAASNIITLTVLIMLIRMLHNYRQKDTLTGQVVNQVNQVDHKDSLNYTALSFSHKPASSKKARVKSNRDESVYAQVKL